MTKVIGSRLSNFILKLDSLTHQAKTKVSQEKHGLSIIIPAVVVLILETLMLLFAIPLSMLITENQLKEHGASEQSVQSYRLRRKVGLIVALLTVVLWIIKLLFTGSLALWIVPPNPVSAHVAGWDFDSTTDYIYDSEKIQIYDGMAIMKVEEVSEEQITPEQQDAPKQAPTIPNENSENTDSQTKKSEQTPESESAVESKDELAPTAPASSEPESTPTSDQSSILGIVRSAYAQGKKCTATITPIASQQVSDLVRWTKFLEVAEKNGGEIYYQLSDDDGKTWYSWRGNAWKVANSTSQRNTAEEVNKEIGSFPVAAGKIKFRAFLVSECIKEIKLISVNIEYEKKSAPSPSVVASISTTPNPSPSVSVSPSITPSPSASVAPSVIPSATPSISPTLSPSPLSSAVVSPSPAASPLPAQSPIASPTPTPTSTPVATPTPTPIASPFTLSSWYVPTAASIETTLAEVRGIFALKTENGGTQITAEFAQKDQGVIVMTGNLPEEGTQAQYLISIVHQDKVIKMYANGEQIAELTGDLILQFDDIAILLPTNVAWSSVALSQQGIAKQYIENKNERPVLEIITSEVTDEGLVILELNIADKESDFVDLASSYALSGEVFTPAEMKMVEKVSQGGTIYGVETTPLGLTYELVWDAKQVLVDYVGDVRIRISARDSVQEGLSAEEIVEVDFASASSEQPTENESQEEVVGETGGSASPSPQASVDPSASPTITPSPESDQQSTQLTNTTNFASTVVETIRNFVANNLFTQDLVVKEISDEAVNLTAISRATSARQSTLVPVPVVVTAEPVLGDRTIKIGGTGVPNSEIILYIFSSEAVVKRVFVDGQGQWSYDHHQDEIELAPGVHSVYAQTILDASNVKSEPSHAQTFSITRNYIVVALDSLDPFTTFLTALVAVAGIMLLRSRESNIVNN